MNEPTPDKPDHKPNIPSQSPSPFGRSLIGWVLIIGLGLLLMTFLTGGLEGKSRSITPPDFWMYARNNEIEGTLIIRETQIVGTLKDNASGLGPEDPRKFTVDFRYRDHENFEEQLFQALGSSAKWEYEFSGWWESMLPHLLLMGLLLVVVWFLVIRRMGAASGGAGFLGNFGRSRHRVSSKEQAKVTFNDVAGIDEAKEEVGEIIEFLKNPRKFQRLGGRVPRGMLLVGLPGCGKTLMAKAIAGEADVPFFSISGSDFVEMFVGVGASRVRDLFKQAKDNSPCIIFLDEIDAVGRRRGMGFTSGGHDEREQTLNAILVEMDGFGSSDQVIVIAATNRMDVLDPALTRPGRFDRQITVPLPDLKGRLEILRIYADKVTCGPDIDLHRVARGTPMFSGADLEALINEAAIAATMQNKDFVEQEDMEEARDKVRWGRARRSRVVDEKEKEITAYHEAGHALVQYHLPEADPLHKVSIIPRGAMGGATFSLPEKDRHLFTRGYCNALLSICFGGRLAEELFCHDISSGAQNDIAQATGIAKRMVLDWGMSEKLGPINYQNDEESMFPMDMKGKPYSDTTAAVIDDEIKAIIDTALANTRRLLEDHRTQLEDLAQALMKYETLDDDDVGRIMKGETLDKPTVTDLLDAEAAKTATPDAPDTEPPPLPDTPPRAFPEPG